MLSWDKTYLEAKAIKAGKAKPLVEFRLLNKYLLRTFKVKIINGDIYEEPVFKTLPLKLRLIFEDFDWPGKLPVKNDEKKALIGDVFLKIIKDHRIYTYPPLKMGELDVQYISFTGLRFEEVKSQISHSKIIDEVGDQDVVQIYRFGNTYYIFYPNQEVLKERKQQEKDWVIRKNIIDLIEEAGFKGKQVDKVTVILDSIENLEHTGNFYNYFR